MKSQAIKFCIEKTDRNLFNLGFSWDLVVQRQVYLKFSDLQVYQTEMKIFPDHIWPFLCGPNVEVNLLELL